MKVSDILRVKGNTLFTMAPLEPLSACAFSLPREAAVSAVSEPEKKPDKTINPKIPAAVSQKAISSVLSMSSCVG